MQNKLLDLNSSPRIQTWIATVKTGKLDCNASKPDKDILNDHTKSSDSRCWNGTIRLCSDFSDKRTPCYRRMIYFQQYMPMHSSFMLEMNKKVIQNSWKIE